MIQIMNLNLIIIEMMKQISLYMPYVFIMGSFSFWQVFKVEGKDVKAEFWSELALWDVYEDLPK